MNSFVWTTGISAVNIDGTTIHSGLKLNLEQNYLV